MFIHQQQLEYLIPPEWYSSQEQFQLEMERLFLPAWHLVGSKSDLPRSGDFLTTQVLDRPLQIRNLDGTYHAFLNVCAHRHCLLTSKKRGNSPRLVCQYHGWEYDASGRTRTIPDARCFRPFDRENARLHKYALESCGDLLFVQIGQQGPSLREFLGDYFEVLEEHFGPPWKQNWAWEHEYESNWKIPVENTLESYHLRFVHSGLFATSKATEEAQEHVLHDDYTTLRYNVGENRLLGGVQAWASRQLGVPVTNIYTHHHVHPNFVVTINDLVCHAQSYMPVTPTTSRTIVRMSSYRPATWNLWKAYLGWATARHGRLGNQRIQLEDAAIFAPAQRGMAATRHPGCLGTREERVYVFQKYVRRMMDNPGSEGCERCDGTTKDTKDTNGTNGTNGTNDTNDTNDTKVTKGTKELQSRPGH